MKQVIKANLKNLGICNCPVKEFNRNQISTYKALNKIKVNWCCRQPQMPAYSNVNRGLMMKNVKLKLAVFGALGLASVQALAAGSLCALAAAPAGSAYINAYNQGRVIPPLAGPATTVLLARMNFGSTADGGAGGNCEITALANETTPPLAGYSLVTSAVRTIPPTTGGAGSIGSVLDIIWRNAAGTTCVFGTRTTFTNADHDSGTAGTQYFEANDVARGGYSASGAVNVGYFKQAANASRLYRVGRTFTSVQHRAHIYGGGTLAQKQNNAAGYLDLPAIAGLTTDVANGNLTLATPGVVAPVGAGLQQAQVNSNWVDFTVDSTFNDPDSASLNPLSPMNYIQAPCNSDSAATINATWVKACLLYTSRCV